MNDDEKMKTSHINNAADCKRVGNAAQAKKQQRSGWKDDEPQVPRNGRVFVAHKISYHETSSADLEERRDRWHNVKPVTGTQTHYHFNFTSVNDIHMRYVSCPCGPCRREEWSTCVNKKYAGIWKHREIVKDNGRSDRELTAARYKRADDLADSLVGDEDAVALYTKEGAHGERMWLMKPTGKPWVVAENDSHRCPISGEKFGPGERVLKGEYYELVPRTTDLYQFRPDLGEFSVPARMLRAGGPTEPIKMVKEATRSSRSRNARQDRNLFRLMSLDRITDLIENVFKDKA